MNEARRLAKVLGAVARSSGFDAARVVARVNDHDELVISIVVPPRTPGEWLSLLDKREAKQRAERLRNA